MKKQILILATLVAVGFSGCTNPSASSVSSTGTVASDSYVVTAEKSLRTAKDTFDLLLHLEYDNRADLEKLSPEIHKYADYIRANAPAWLVTANNLKNTYKHNRSAENKASLATALVTISAAVLEAQKYITLSAKVGI